MTPDSIFSLPRPSNAPVTQNYPSALVQDVKANLHNFAFDGEVMTQNDAPLENDAKNTVKYGVKRGCRENR